MFYTKKSPSCGGNCCWYWMPIKKSSGFYRISYYKPEWKRKEISKHDASYTVYTLVRVTLRYLCKCVCVSLSDLQLLIHSCAEVHRTTAKWAIDTFVSVRWGDTRLKLSHLWAHTKQQTKRIEKRNSNNLQRKIQKEKKIKKNKKLPNQKKVRNYKFMARSLSSIGDCFYASSPSRSISFSPSLSFSRAVSLTHTSISQRVSQSVFGWHSNDSRQQQKQRLNNCLQRRRVALLVFKLVLHTLPPVRILHISHCICNASNFSNSCICISIQRN